ncbi:hypothetical protein [Neobacillus jeddahensis]|nr:hypothetical protein [Neobacillus jeddahensis]
MQIKPLQHERSDYYFYQTATWHSKKNIYRTCFKEIEENTTTLPGRVSW